MNISLLGPPGSGKGTLARRLSAQSNLAIFETGAVLRAWAAQKDPKLSQRLAEGEMAETPLVIKLLRESLDRPPQGSKGWLIDGTPRNVDQAEEIIRQRDQHGFALDIILVLDCPEEVCRQRLSGRLNCERCGSSYNSSTPSMLPPNKSMCREECGGLLTIRPDDQPAGIEQRLKLYRERTEPGIALLQKSQVPLVRIDGSQDIQEVVGQVGRILAEFQAPRKSRLDSPGRGR